MSDQLVVKVATYTTHKKHKRRTSMPSLRIEPATPDIYVYIYVYIYGLITRSEES
jgi:hypothetical protein